MTPDIPPFRPHPLLRDGHWQTVVGRYLPVGLACPPTRDRKIALADGDRLLVLDSTPEGWSPGGPIALLIHGLAGCARSPYVVRLAAKLHRRGVRVARMNLRGAGSGFGLARGIYHGGRSEDLRAVAEVLADEAPGSPIALVGFSLGGALALKLAAEASRDPVAGLDCVLAASPPLDLGACARNMRRPGRRIYDRNFVKSLRAEIRRLHATFPDLGPIDLAAVRTVYDFDDAYTAPRNGFADAADYYARSSVGPMLSRIAVPGLVVHASDDPFIPVESLSPWEFPPGLALELIPRGGHLGFVSRSPWDGDHRWLETRLAAWLGARWEATFPDPGPNPRTRQGGLFAHECRPQQ